MTKNAAEDPHFRFRPPSESQVLGKPKERPVIIPGFEGIPIRGISDPNQVTPEMLQKLVTANDVHFRLFDVSEQTGVEEYERLMCAAGTLPNVCIIKEWTPEGFGTAHWKIAVKWYERYKEPRFYRGIMTSDGNPLGVR